MRQSRLTELALSCIISSATTRGFLRVELLGEDLRFTGHDQTPWDWLLMIDYRSFTTRYSIVTPS